VLSMKDAGELLGVSERQFRRFRDCYEEDGEEGLRDRRLGRPSLKKVPAVERSRMLKAGVRIFLTPVLPGRPKSVPAGAGRIDRRTDPPRPALLRRQDHTGIRRRHERASVPAASSIYPTWRAAS
jgi:hypothetical protein